MIKRTKKVIKKPRQDYQCEICGKTIYGQHIFISMFYGLCSVTERRHESCDFAMEKICAKCKNPCDGRCTVKCVAGFEEGLRPEMCQDMEELCGECETLANWEDLFNIGRPDGTQMPPCPCNNCRIGKALARLKEVCDAEKN